jgi:hypothetical protein
MTSAKAVKIRATASTQRLRMRSRNSLPAMVAMIWDIAIIVASIRKAEEESSSDGSRTLDVAHPAPSAPGLRALPSWRVAGSAG